MEKRSFPRGAFVGVILLAVMVLVLMLVPVIAAGDIVQVGTSDILNPTHCYMKDRDGFITVKTDEVFINETPGSTYPSDVVAVLKCRATIVDDNYNGSAVTYPGSNSPTCRAYFDPLNDLSKSAFTSSWSETISASGNAVLTCQFKKN